METILVLSGVTNQQTIEDFPYRPFRILDSVADIVVE
jgi:NagD protein